MWQRNTERVAVPAYVLALLFVLVAVSIPVPFSPSSQESGRYETYEVEQVMGDQGASDCNSHRSTPLLVLVNLSYLTSFQGTSCKNVCNTDGHIEQKPEDIFVRLPAFEADMVVPSQLVIVVDSAHVLVQDY